MPDAPQEITLLDSTRTGSEWLKLLCEVMRDCGSAAQTLGALWSITQKKTFVPVSDIAVKARLPIATVRKHLVTLAKHGWIKNTGRHPLHNGWLRRTSTIEITDKTRKAMGKADPKVHPRTAEWDKRFASIVWDGKSPLKSIPSVTTLYEEIEAAEKAGTYKRPKDIPDAQARVKAAPTIPDGMVFGVLPWWGSCKVSYKLPSGHRPNAGRTQTACGRLPWCAKAVLSVVLARLMGLKKAAIMDGFAQTEEDVISAIEDSMGGDSRFAFSLRDLVRDTGLTRESVVIAKQMLNHRFGILSWKGTAAAQRAKKGTTIEKDLLVPNWDFRVIVTQAGEGRCYVKFN